MIDVHLAYQKGIMDIGGGRKVGCHACHFPSLHYSHLTLRHLLKWNMLSLGTSIGLGLEVGTPLVG